MRENDPIDINLADEETLASLPGIGAALAARIVTYRETVHPFEEVIELAAVPGISERMVQELADLVTVGDPPESGAPASAPEPDGEQLSFPEVEPEPVTNTVTAPGRGMETAVQPAQHPAPPTTRGVTPSQRRGCVFVLLGSLLGALLGAVLTLAGLAFLNNGSLQYAQENSRLRGEVGVMQQNQTALQAQLDAAQIDAAAAAAGLATAVPFIEQLATRQGGLLQAQATLQANLAGVDGELAELAGKTAVIAEQIDDVAATAAQFDAFLSGLRTLLADFDSITPAETPVATLTPMPGTPDSGAENGGTPEPTPMATRTPRPTATPIASTPFPASPTP